MRTRKEVHVHLGAPLHLNTDFGSNPLLEGEAPSQQDLPAGSARNS